MRPRTPARRAGYGPRFSRPARRAPLGLAVVGALLLCAVPPVVAQHQGHAHDREGSRASLESFVLERHGLFEVWQDTTRLGTEEYRRYRNAAGDSVITASTVRYRIAGPAGPVSFEKRTSLVLHGHGPLMPISYQSHELMGEETRALNTVFNDTVATVNRESEGHGVAQTMAVPPGRICVLDPNVYEHIEWLVAEFAERGLESRTQSVVVPSRTTVVEVKLSRGPEEEVATPWGEQRAVRIELSDDLTLIRAWVDAEGRLVRLEAPAQKVRVVRLPASQDGPSPDAPRGRAAR